MFYLSNYKSPLGETVLISDGNSLCGLYFKGRKYSIEEVGEPVEANRLLIFQKTKNELEKYFNKEPFNFSKIPLNLAVSSFRRKVFNIVLKIPYGITMSYGMISKQISNNMPPRAVGSAIGHNPVLIIIPCHRVIAANGGLGGYSAGLEIKKGLLKLEGAL